MTLSDITLLIKKILIGIAIAIIPFIILGGGLRLTQKLLGDHASNNSQEQLLTKQR